MNTIYVICATILFLIGLGSGYAAFVPYKNTAKGIYLEGLANVLVAFAVSFLILTTI